MTEAEWRACTDSEEMAGFLYYHFKDQESPWTQHAQRKLALLGCACLRRIWHLLTDERSRQAVEFTERTMEEKASDDAYISAHRAALDGWAAMAEAADKGKYATPLLCALPDAGLAAYHAIDVDIQCVGNAAHAMAGFVTGKDEHFPEFERALADEMLNQNQIIRCVFGNPFHPVHVQSSWLTPTVVSLARSAYEQRILPEGKLDARYLADLADALEEAGCDNSEILAHCREPGPHVRGCWVVDLMLGKE
jgi:hypothetical protein